MGKASPADGLTELVTALTGLCLGDEQARDLAAAARRVMTDFAPLAGLALGELRPATPMPPPAGEPVAATSAKPAAAREAGPETGSVAEIGLKFRGGTITPSELLERVLAHLDAVEPAVSAWHLIDQDGARAAAAQATRELAEGVDRGPLHGIPVGVKDLIDTAGLATGAGSRHFDGRVPAADASCVTALRQAGAVIVGKTATHEFALGGTTPPTRNPWVADRVPGGSSGGSAAAIATGTCLVALGTDTGGSVRIPSTLCGIAGLKPTFGLIPADGVIPLAWSLDTVGPMGRRCADVAALLAALSPDFARSAGPGYFEAGLGGLRIGVPRSSLFSPAQPGVLSAVDAALAVLGREGAQLVDVEFETIQLSAAVCLLILVAEASEYHRERMRTHPGKFAPDVRAFLESAQLLPASAYVRALRVQRLIQSEIIRALGDVDVLALPTMPCTAAPYGAGSFDPVDLDGISVTLAEAHVRNTAPFNLAGLPAGSLPCGFDKAGLPVGLQIVGRPYAEDMVLRVMRGFERATGWHDQIAPAAIAPGGTAGPLLSLKPA